MPCNRAILAHFWPKMLSHDVDDAAFRIRVTATGISHVTGTEVALTTESLPFRLLGEKRCGKRRERFS
jgi:hypothetical protein